MYFVPIAGYQQLVLEKSTRASVKITFTGHHIRLLLYFMHKMASQSGAIDSC